MSPSPFQSRASTPEIICPVQDFRITTPSAEESKRGRLPAAPPLVLRKNRQSSSNSQARKSFLPSPSQSTKSPRLGRRRSISVASGPALIHFGAPSSGAALVPKFL